MGAWSAEDPLRNAVSTGQARKEKEARKDHLKQEAGYAAGRRERKI